MSKPHRTNNVCRAGDCTAKPSPTNELISQSERLPRSFDENSQQPSGHGHPNCQANQPVAAHTQISISMNLCGVNTYSRESICSVCHRVP